MSPFFYQPPRTGGAHPNARLNDARVRRIRKQNKEGVSIRALAKEYGVSESTISRIVNGRAWTHVK